MILIIIGIITVSTSCTDHKTIWLYAKINLPYDLTSKVVHKSQNINDEKIMLKYVKSSNLKANKKSYVMDGIKQLNGDIFLRGKTLSSCNLKIEYIKKYIDKYNSILEDMARD